MDLSRFKKVSSDNKCTTLMHEGGHTLKVAHKGLSPKLLSDLGNLPIHKAQGGSVQKFAEGTDPEGAQPQQGQAPVTINIGGPQAQPQMPVTGVAQNGTPNALMAAPPQQAPVAPVEAAPAPEPQSVKQVEPVQAPQPAPAEPAMAEAPQAEQGQPQSPQDQQEAPSEGPVQGPKTFDDYKMEHQQQMISEDQAFANDLTNGHITPKTYSDLMGKSTLGKISSLFGLMIAGAGAGLSHQPNALLQMMDNEIKRDLDAQVQSKTNAQSLYKLNLQHEMQSAQIEQYKKQGLFTEAQAEQATQDAKRKAYDLSNMQANRLALHNLTETVNKLPVGSPQRQQAEQMLGMLSQSVQNENYSIADRSAASGAYMKTLLGNSGANSEETFQKNNKAKMLLGTQGAEMSKYENDRHMSGVPEIEGQNASRSIPEDKRSQITAMQTLSDKGRDLLQYAQQHKGSIDPKVIAVGAQKAEEMLNFYNDSIHGGVLTKGRMDWLDKQIKKNPTSIFQDVLGNNAQLEEIVNSNNNRKGILLKSLGFNPKMESKHAPQEENTIERLDPTSGKTVIFDAKTKKPLRWK